MAGQRKRIMATFPPRCVSSRIETMKGRMMREDTHHGWAKETHHGNFSASMRVFTHRKYERKNDARRHESWLGEEHASWRGVSLHSGA
jgi:hypothetical protein